MLLSLSLGMAMPVSIARTAGLDMQLSGSLLAASLFCMGFSDCPSAFYRLPLRPDFVSGKGKNLENSTYDERIALGGKFAELVERQRLDA